MKNKLYKANQSILWWWFWHIVVNLVAVFFSLGIFYLVLTNIDITMLENKLLFTVSLMILALATILTLVNTIVIPAPPKRLKP